MSVPIAITHLFAYEGPNMLGPQPAVLLRVRAAYDCSQQLKDGLKDAAQFVGITMAYLDVTTTQANGSFALRASFTTTSPLLGADIAAHVVEHLAQQPRHSKDDDNHDGHDDHDEEDRSRQRLFELQRRRRREALRAPALQMIAAARQHDVPVLHLPDGGLQLGYGAQGWRCDLHALQARARQDEDEPPAPPPVPPWQHIGFIPLYVVTGERRRGEMVRQVVAHLQADGHAPRVLEDADYAATLALLADNSTRQAVIGLRTSDILRRGVAFTRCTQCIISDMQGTQPAEAATPEEWAHALGVPMLLSSAPAILNMADAAVASLAPYAPHGFTPLPQE